MTQQNNTTEYQSLYEFRGHGVRGEEGKLVYAEAKSRGIQVQNREVSNSKYKGLVITYPKWFLEEYFHKADPKDSIIDADDTDLFDELPF